MNWIMVLVMVAINADSYGQPVVQTIYFQSQELCQSAGADIIKHLPSYYISANYSCEQTATFDQH